MPNFGPYNSFNKNNKETFTSTNNTNNTNNTTNNPSSNNDNSFNSTIIISPYLDKYMQMWIWDWDDTLVDTRAYYRHSMNPDFIRNTLTNEQLLLDVPNYQYFKDLVYYLTMKGVRVGIASFGTYSIIRAYMDKIFGMNQHIFTQVNIYASCQELGESRDYHNMPINKNYYIQKMMNHYKLNNYSTIVLFDDNSINIADALRLGVFAVQIDIPVSPEEKDKILIKNALFSPLTMMDLESRLRDGCKRSGIPTEFMFGYLGDRKVWKRKAQEDAEMLGKVLKPNFTNEGFQSDVPLNAPKPDPYAKLFKNKDPVVEGFYNQEVGVYPSRCNTNTNTNNTLEGFSQCLNCQNPFNTYLIGIIFIAMISMITLCIYYG